MGKHRMIFLFDDFGGIREEDYGRLLESAGAGREKILSYQFGEDRMLSAVSSAVIRLMTGGAEVFTDPLGKPFAEGCAFNISHCRMCVAGVAFNGAGAAGIDAEPVREGFDSDILPFCFTGLERRQIETGRDSAEMFYRLWTLKESCVKAIGTGVRDLLRIEFDLTGNTIKCSDSRFCFYSFRHKNYRISACVGIENASALTPLKIISMEELRNA